jgi:hypothetical protein
LASWATILGAVLSVFSLIQSRAWLTGIGVLLVGVSVAAGMYAKRERLAIQSASVVIEGKSIDALNAANLKRRLNKTLVIQEVRHAAQIDGEDLSFFWQYTGYCQAERETAIQFSIDAESAVPFEQLNCLAHDLSHDPGGKHPIRPILMGADGISKKIAVPFLEPLNAQQSFNVALECRITQLLRQGDSKVFKKYSQMKLQMKREALLKMNRQANEEEKRFDTGRPN